MRVHVKASQHLALIAAVISLSVALAHRTTLDDASARMCPHNERRPAGRELQAWVESQEEEEEEWDYQDEEE